MAWGVRVFGSGLLGRSAIASAAGGFCLFVLASCATPGSSGETAQRGSDAAAPVGDAERIMAQRAIHAGLTRGVERYHLGPGDVVRLVFTGNPEPQQSEYLIGVRDRLRVEFFYHPQLSRTIVVRPDGRITLPLRGDIVAAGRTPAQLAAQLQELYQDVYRDPVVTVSVEEFSSALVELTDSLKSSPEGRAKQVIVAPDGLAFVPLLPPITASGRTVEELQTEINRLYRSRFGDVTASVSLEKVAGDRVFVFGEVKSPGMITLPGPKTTLQVITAAGGPLITGALERVKVLYWSPDGESRLRTLDLEAGFESGTIEGDLLLPANTVVYVPPTTIAKLDRLVDQYIRQLFLFNGWGFTLFYNLNPQDAVTVPR